MESAGSEARTSVWKFAPFPTARWWCLHLVLIATVYAIGHLVFGG